VIIETDRRLNRIRRTHFTLRWTWVQKSEHHNDVSIADGRLFHVGRDSPGRQAYEPDHRVQCGRCREDIRQEMNHVQGILVLEGGAPVRAAGSPGGRSRRERGSREGGGRTRSAP